MTDVSGGFLKPTTTPTPDELFDVWLSKLSGSELKVLLYIVRRTFGFQKEADAISLSQICQGISTRDGRTLDHGTGLTRTTAYKAVQSLEKYGLVLVTRVEHEDGSPAVNVYSLRFRSACSDDTDDSTIGPNNSPDADSEAGEESTQGRLITNPGVGQEITRGGLGTDPGVGQKSTPQQTALQETVSQQTVRQETEHQQPPSPPLMLSQTPNALASALQPQAGGNGEMGSDTVLQRARPQLTLIHPSPVTQPSHEPVSQERQRAVAALVDFGVWRTRAEQLVDKLDLSPEEVERACAVLNEERQRGSDIANPGAVLAARLEAGWEPPPLEPPPNPYAKWDIDEGELAGSGLPADHRPPLPPVVTANGVEHGAYVWFDDLKDELQLQLVRETYNTWLRRAQLVDHIPAAGDTSATLTIRLHNVYARAWIEHRLHRVILRQAVRMLGRAVRLVYVGPEEAEEPEEEPPWWRVAKCEPSVSTV